MAEQWRFVSAPYPHCVVLEVSLLDNRKLIYLTVENSPLYSSLWFSVKICINQSGPLILNKLCGFFGEFFNGIKFNTVFDKKGIFPVGRIQYW